MPDNPFSVFEKLTDEELVYKKYDEVKNDPKLLAEFLSTIAYGEYWFPEVNYKYQHAEITHTIFDYFENEICVTKHTRYYPLFYHQHTFYELIYVAGGSCNNTVEGKTFHMNEGNICIIPPGVAHAIGVFDKSIIINILLKQSLFQKSFLQTLPNDNSLVVFFVNNLYANRKQKDNYLFLATQPETLIRELLTHLIVEGLKQDDDKLYLMKSLLSSFLNALIKYNISPQTKYILTQNKMRISSKMQLINDILKYIQDNHQHASLKEAAHHFLYSEQYLSTLIRDATGSTFVSLLQNAKISHACFLLATTKTKICDIPYIVGYENLNYFNRMFKKVTGLTPTRYREIYVHHIPREVYMK